MTVPCTINETFKMADIADHRNTEIILSSGGDSQCSEYQNTQEVKNESFFYYGLDKAKVYI